MAPANRTAMGRKQKNAHKKYATRVGPVCQTQVRHGCTYTPNHTHTMTMASVAMSCSHYVERSVCFLCPLRDALIRRQYNSTVVHLDAAMIRNTV